MEKMYKTTRFFGEELLAPRPTPKLEENFCRLSATAYSIYSQLPSRMEAVSSSSPRTLHAVVAGTHLSRALVRTHIEKGEGF